MYLFLPIINNGISNLTKFELKLVVLSTLGIFAFWRDYKNPNIDIFHLNAGNCVFWLLTFYITGAYIGKYRIDYSGIKKYIYCFTCLFLYLFCIFLFYKSCNKELFLGKGYYSQRIVIIISQLLNKRYDAILKIIQTISITLFFLQIKYNKYISKIITFFGKLAFGIYLIHVNEIIFLKRLPIIIKKMPNNLSFYSTIFFIANKSLIIFFICIAIDYIRNLIFNILRIRKICIFLEKMIFKLG